MRVFFLSVFMTFFTFLYAGAVIGSVAQAKGNVKIKSEDSFKKSKVEAGLEVKEGDLITTAKKSSAIIKLSDGSTVVLDESSSVVFANSSSVEQKEGKIYYKITSRDAKNALKVTTPFAIIGIKGTTFIVNATQNASVSLKEGLIGVQSIKEEFALYRKELQKQFDNYVNEQQSEFEKYKNAQTQGVAEMTKEFDLQAGNTITFSGNNVNEKAWNENDDAEFAHFEELINSLK
ncbi:FecR family protein [bacterium]|nr:FecR family protein [bacterium]MBU1990712.1 FecR family protein [bacterium]